MMKYFKYKNMNKVQRIADKEYLASLGQDKEKKIKRSRRLEEILIVFGFILFFSLLATLIYLITLIPKPTHVFLLILYGIGCVILGFVGLILSGILSIVPMVYLLDKVDYDYPRMSKEFISKACEPIRKHYGLSEEYLITKCFSASNSYFNNHDICIFRFDNEIRITTDIVKGFINDHCDLGCYSIKFDELKVYKADYDNKRVTVLEFGNEKFIVGIKAYSYIIKLINTKTYKYMFNSLSINDEAIYLRRGKKINIIKLNSIVNVTMTIPMYSSIPGAGCNYDYTIDILGKDLNRYRLSIVLERNEEKELIKFLKDKNIEVILKYYDNKHDGD